MKTLIRNSTLITIGLLAFEAMPVVRLSACGLDWRLPTNHFDGVSSQGYVAYWEKVADVDFGDGLKLPLVIGFRSNKENGAPSPYLGSGWILPLLESSIVQTGEDSFVMMQPDGWNNLFLRKDDTTLNGSAGWMAEIRGDTITAWARCGWKIEFYKGRIVSMTTPQNRKLDFTYSGNMVTAIKENGIEKLATEQVPETGQADALLFNGKRLQIVQAEKPWVQSILGQNLVARMDESLRSIMPSDGATRSFEFAVNDKFQPTLKATSNTGKERLFAWDPTTERVVSDNDWSYQVTAPGTPLANAGIARTNAKKQTEYWSYDGAEGREISEGIDGVTRVKTHFVSGYAAGQPRRIEEIVGGKTTILQQWEYDEKGQLVRRRIGESTLTINPDRIYLTKGDETEWTLLIHQ